MPQDYFPSGPFLSQLPDAGKFDRLREDFLLGFAERTARAYKADLEDFREWCAAEGVESLTPSREELRRYLASVQARGYATGTVLRRTSALRGFFGDLVARGLLSGSPADRLRPASPELEPPCPQPGLRR